ncbi:hypothetical protein J6A31_06170 [bacterium]|nr:hypothetical protein [bacterium]
MDSIVICYTCLSTNEKSYCETYDVDAWKKLNPDKQINMMFRKKWDIVNQQSFMADAFMVNCSSFGFSQADLNKKFISANGHTITLIGMKPNNRKYKFMIFDENDDKTYKVSRHYMEGCTRI